MALLHFHMYNTLISHTLLIYMHLETRNGFKKQLKNNYPVAGKIDNYQ